MRAQGRLVSPEEFGRIVIRENPDGSVVRLTDVARIELGAQLYNVLGRLNGKPAANIAIYQLPGSNALDGAKAVRAEMEVLKKSFPGDLDYDSGLDTTQAVSEGMREISQTLWQALLLVVLVVFIFLQGWRATLIPLLAVPVSLIGTFILFPAFGFSINTLSLFGLVLAIGLVVDDAIVVVEAAERHIEEGLSPRDAALKAMEEVAAPVVAIAIILAAVFVPTAFIPGITGRLYQQFALTIAISVIISAFNALSLSPALCALLLRPRKASGGPLSRFYDAFNRMFRRATTGYVGGVQGADPQEPFRPAASGGVRGLRRMFRRGCPPGSCRRRTRVTFIVRLQLPNAASLQRTAAAAAKVEDILAHTPGVKNYTSVIGFNLLQHGLQHLQRVFFCELQAVGRAHLAGEKIAAIQAHLDAALRKIPDGNASSFSPPSIPGVGTAGGVTFVLEDRAGRDIAFLNDNLTKFMAAAKKRPELDPKTDDDVPADRSAGFCRTWTGTRCSSRACRSDDVTGHCSATWAASSSIISTGSAASGRSTCEAEGQYRHERRGSRPILRP